MISNGFIHLKRHQIIILCCFLLFVGGLQIANPTYSSTPGDPNLVKYVGEVTEEIDRNWVASQASGKVIKIGFVVMQNGIIKDVKVIQSSESAQLDDECLESVYASSPLIYSKLPVGYDQLGIQLNFDQKRCRFSSKISLFRQRHVVALDKCVFHIIPISVLNRYPKVFSLRRS